VADLNNITFACENPVPLAEFWAAALGYKPVEPPPEVLSEVEKAIGRGELDPTGWAMLVHPQGSGPGCCSSDVRKRRPSRSRSISTSSQRTGTPRWSG
jgi:hypothetical protein